VNPGAPGRPFSPPAEPGPVPPGDDSVADTGAGDGRDLGAAGEAVTVRWYEGQGYEILDRDWRRREGVVDLIARRGRTVAFCEVTSDTSDGVGSGAAAVLPAKQRRMRRLAARWLSELTPASGRSLVEVRFDVASITGGEVDVSEGAF